MLSTIGFDMPSRVADLLVGESLELAHHDDPVMALGQAAEGSAQIVESLLVLDRSVGRRRSDELARSAVGVVVVLERDLAHASRPAELVDAGVLGDLVEPRLERDRPLGVAQAAQRGDEHLLGDVLGAGVVADHPEHVGADPAAVARVELLERTVAHRA